MKRCPICQNTFDDSMRFCQVDGTALVDESGGALPSDSLKTIIGGAPIQDSADDVSQFGDDATKTLFPPGGSLGGQTPFDETRNSNPSQPFDDSFSLSSNYGSSPFTNESSSGSSFGNSSSSSFDAPDYQSPAKPFDEPQPFNPNAFGGAANQYGQPLAQSSWTPPPAPDAGWQSQNIGANTPFQPPIAGSQGQNQTLPIISLICGILSVACCWIGFLVGPAALVTGYLGRKNADTNPSEYGGSGMALAGMITGGIGALISFGYLLLMILGVIGSSIGQ